MRVSYKAFTINVSVPASKIQFILFCKQALTPILFMPSIFKQNIINIKLKFIEIYYLSTKVEIHFKLYKAFTIILFLQPKFS